MLVSCPGDKNDDGGDNDGQSDHKGGSFHDRR